VCHDLASPPDALDPRRRWDRPFRPGRRGDVEIVYIDRVHGFGLFLMPGAPLA